MREQALEDNLVEDYIDKNETTGREAKAFAYSAVVDLLASDEDLHDDDLDALDDFEDLFEDFEE